MHPQMHELQLKILNKKLNTIIKNIQNRWDIIEELLNYVASITLAGFPAIILAG